MNEKNTKSDAALREEKVLEFWRENKIFDKSLEATKKGKEFIFYEGPPTANGKPGIHHLEARAFKDAIPRYKTMRGYHVRRKAGWDTHGLPVELQVEKKLGFKSKLDIEAYGIAKFNKECKDNVWELLGDWNKFTERIGYWLDQEHPYVTYHNSFMESVWNVIKETDKQKLLYKDYKVVPWCPRCGTVLSSHELAQGYEEVKDLSIYAKFKIQPEQKNLAALPSLRGLRHGLDFSAPAYFLAWTTTPWTLPGNIALAVGEKITYVEAKVGGEILILAKERLSVLPEGYEIVAEHTGKDLVGMEYEPLFPFLADNMPEAEKPKLAKAFKVYPADFVNTEDGTGIVHTAVMYGQDDFVLGTSIGLPKFHLVNPEGKFVGGTGFLEGRFVKETNADGKPTLAVDIIEDLKKRNLFFKQENYKHSYPHCWRCKTALIYYARDSWYIRMSEPKIKKKLIDENKTINWEPEYTREGRFGEWLREIKDWAISRERYWGTPLPVWICDKCQKWHLVGSVEDMKKKTIKSGNKYLLMRHGGAESNAKGFVSSSLSAVNPLTPAGQKQVENALKILKKHKINLIISSPIQRAKETAEIVRAGLNLSADKLIFDERLREIGCGVLDGRPITEYWAAFSESKDRFTRAPEGGETLAEVKKRTGMFLEEVEQEYQGKTILFISHEDALWMLMSMAEGKNREESLVFKNSSKEFFRNAEVKALTYTSLPHNEEYELDLHRPYIDEVKLACDCGGKAVRTKEVMDVWMDSGAMPFAQDHYPFENKKWVEGAGYPADFISEAIDQTRGWFYTLHAVGILMGRGKAYKNVICLGHLLDAVGKKMSKSLGNIVDPWLMMDKYGVDTLRLWMYSVNQPGESKNFDEKTVALFQQQFFGLLYNVLAFYELYRDKSLEKNDRPKSKNILDQWILARLDELVKLSTENLDKYKLLEPTRATKDFIGDLSTWYLRRSRERIKEGDKDAKQTLYFVLKTVAKLMAPFAPFAAEDIWLKLKNEKDKESVHLAEWPKANKIVPSVIDNMRIVRDVVSLGLKERQKLEVQVKQPLPGLGIYGTGLKQEYVEIIQEELNVKLVTFNQGGEFGIKLDTNITEELKQEGNYRELLRAVQDMRKKMGLTPSEKVKISFETNDAGKNLVEKFEKDMKKVAMASVISFEDNDGEEAKISDLVFKVKISK